ncbi:MAG: large conductance mechanosensitive channel protein MscL [bacterium]|nr:large conductance mechanosensitive channel protein MscL [bacterium]
MIEEFKKFIMRGNVLDLAVGVVMGNAFSKIVSSLVNDIMMPFIGVIIGGHDFSNLSIKAGSASIMYGSFIQNVIDFLIIAFSIFIFIKIINTITKKKEKEDTKKDKAKEVSEEVLLLREIRDSLKK